MKALKSTYSKLGIILTVLSVMLLAACGGTGEKEKSGSEPKGYSVKHAMGTTKVNSAKRVVVLTNEGTEAVLAMGVKPVGAVKSWLGNPWYDHIKADMKGVEVVGDESQVNLEKIASLKPDLIIGNKMRQEKIYDQLNKIAPTVFSEDLRGNWKNNFKLYSKALNKEKEGNKVISDYDQRVKDIKEKAGDSLNKEISVVRFMPGVSRIYLTNSFSGVVLDQLGFKRPKVETKDDFVAEVTKEQIPQMDGDELFYFTYEAGDGGATKQEKEWTNDPLWKNLSAVKKGHVHKVSDAIWNTAGGVKAANLMLDDIEKYLVK
ncbi:iron-siderophore ABC transporter substrate-binding protein [Fictibacillus sp. WQ 8-8]|uniref:ABC transporter substrate-binding protein n=1 Tax=unclassified Fictibacillus TaxID=2644029 RepID=UPI00210E01D7|nr:MULTISPECIES: iron-siderophore ABC transporter substrate-binding protein [unclassified Fictibacillus]MCQ6265422.1 iron-siderophore ABC transporter substrate-binding protein [Fictibacillus sp. WQ 8-8]MED2973677.1 iron-siderophore ABC transporter substrate-binding protein [Fictibacillus sp. B-59209]